MFKKIVSVFLVSAMMLLLVGCVETTSTNTTSPTETTQPTQTKVSVATVVKWMGIGVNIYNVAVPMIISGMTPEQKAAACPVLEKIKLYWNNAVKFFAAFMENKGNLETKELVLNLTSFNEAVTELFSLAGVDPKYTVYFTGIVTAIKMITTTFIPNLTYVEGESYDTSLLTIKVSCGAAKMKADPREDLKKALGTVDPAELPKEIKAVAELVK